jgi:Tol biopolymer transport system component
MRPDGTGIQPLLISSHRDIDASWHGDAVVFTRRISDGSSNLFRIPVGGGPLIQLTQSGQASMPAWSPDGRWIAFADGPAVGGRYDIKAVRAFGEEVRPLSLRSAGGGGRNPTWLSHQ